MFAADGTQVGKLSTTYNLAGAEPHGCAFAPDGTLFTSDVGFQGFGPANGQLIEWFAPYDVFPGPPGAYPNTNDISTNACKLATDLGTAGAVLADAQGRIYVAESSGLRIDRFSPPFPTGPDAAHGCGRVDATGAPLATAVQREVFVGPAAGMVFAGLAFAPNGNIYASSVFTGRIAEFDTDGQLVRDILAPPSTTLPIPTGNPQDIAVGKDGTIYYADLDLRGTLPDVGPGPNGKVWRIRFNGVGDPLPPEVVRQGLAFPDGVALFPGDLEASTPPPLEWPTLAGGPHRTFFNANETQLTAQTAPQLIEKWRFPTKAVVTSSPSVATVEIPNRGRTRAAFFSSWDGNIYAVDWATGKELWHFAWPDQPGASFLAAGSPTVTDVDSARVVLVGVGETMYALDAVTGTERWHFAAGTGCRDPLSGNPPGLCSFRGERNQIESTPIVVDGVAYFGMDINDVATGKGGFYAVDVADGTLDWFFDSRERRGVPSGRRRRDPPLRRLPLGKRARAARGLLHDPFGLRPPAHAERLQQRLVVGRVRRRPRPLVLRHEQLRHRHRPRRRRRRRHRCRPTTRRSSRCTPTARPLGVGGRARSTTPTSRSVPRRTSSASTSAAGRVDVLGIGSKDGTYYVLDRDGTNVRDGVDWDDTDPSGLPYWRTKLSPGGDTGGVIGTASVDEAARRVSLSTAPGDDVVAPQQPTVHALNLDSGAVIWQNTGATGLAGDASFGPTSAVPGVVIVGSVVTPHLRMYDATNGALLLDRNIGEPGTLSGIASGAAVVDGTVVVGGGIGTRTSGGSSPGDFTANTPSALVALCVPGTPDCAPPTRRTRRRDRGRRQRRHDRARHPRDVVAPRRPGGHRRLVDTARPVDVTRRLRRRVRCRHVRTRRDRAHRARARER